MPEQTPEYGIPYLGSDDTLKETTDVAEASALAYEAELKKLNDRIAALEASGGGGGGGGGGNNPPTTTAEDCIYGMTRGTMTGMRMLLKEDLTPATKWSEGWDHENDKPLWEFDAKYQHYFVLSEALPGVSMKMKEKIDFCLFQHDWTRINNPHYTDHNWDTVGFSRMWSWVHESKSWALKHDLPYNRIDSFEGPKTSMTGWAHPLTFFDVTREPTNKKDPDWAAAMGGEPSGYTWLDFADWDGEVAYRNTTWLQESHYGNEINEMRWDTSWKDSSDKSVIIEGAAWLTSSGGNKTSLGDFDPFNVISHDVFTSPQDPDWRFRFRWFG